ncbi:glycoside hydrolase [Xanthomonas sp. WHRI 1810A]|uniref:glycoside hydrolase n=1 Tax=Xanthomonas sp. WHRI 1810A TaxID=3161565 RepID=UPI0032E88CEE
MSSFFRFFCCALFCAVFFIPDAKAVEVLENEFWRVDIDPATLAIAVAPSGGRRVQASAGVVAHSVSEVKRTPDSLKWQWDRGVWQLAAQLDQRELRLSIKAREAGVLDFLKQPGDAMGKALIWPLAEGHYVPRGDLVWQRFLVDQGPINTTQDLSLPLWGMDHGAFTLNWLMTNPFNNRLELSADADALAISARHAFTALDPTAPLTFRLVLGDADPLFGARRYRQWLMESGRYETLDDKLKNVPQGRKLLGAAHVYVWGNDLLDVKDVLDWTRLVETLSSAAPLAVELRRHLNAEASAILRRRPAPPERWQQATLLRGLNAAANTVARASWQSTTEPDMQRLASRYGELRRELAQLFVGALKADTSEWGGTLSRSTIAQLSSAGLSRLWLGLGDGWEGGLWHPEAVSAAVQARYLIAPYDSYETALAADENPDWSTAHLGSNAHRNCAIVLEDGTFKSGFQQSGHYTNPRCVRPLLEARVRAVQAASGFNSWFLDAYATGMVFDSYRPETPMTQAQNAAANEDAARWVGAGSGLPVGSEDGNAVTAQGILFAHGMQTPVIGWGDSQMNQDKQSPWYVGNWYPPEQPDVFFKTVPVKEPYRTVHFEPTTRLPLYQTVFHGSVITTHHWLFDSLKLSNVRFQNELTQLLYNVPPLYHLSRETMKQRLPVILRQDAFFRPLHERLATQAMTGFDWLTADRQLQQTTFADGTRLVANFDVAARGAGGRSFPAHSITAIRPDGSEGVYQVMAER